MLQKRGRSLGRNDDGLQKVANGFADHRFGMKKFWSGQEKPVGTAKRCFRVKVVGSNPAGPTKSLFWQNERIKDSLRIAKRTK